VVEDCAKAGEGHRNVRHGYLVPPRLFRFPAHSQNWQTLARFAPVWNLNMGLLVDSPGYEIRIGIERIYENARVRIREHSCD